ncbi:MAG TPA: hypothetical protein VFK05_28845 [Polyangiaceae bacterium]|nr:hypothetical protein [Polyangiaceae bacterium]
MIQLDWRMLAVFCLVGCSAKVVDLDQQPPAMASDDAVVVLTEERASVWVDEQRLYWVTGFRKIQSCRKTDCAHTLVDYTSSVRGENETVNAVVSGAHVYWTSTSQNTIYSCPSDGCEPTPRIVTKDPALRSSPFADGDYVYWASAFDIYRCPAEGCDGAPELVAADSTAQAMAFDEQRAYWNDGTRIMSAPKDGSEQAELLLDGIDEAQLNLTVGDGALYRSDGKSIFRCAAGNCSASPRAPLVTGEGRVSDIRLDGNKLYWIDADALRSCTLPDCSELFAITPASPIRAVLVGDERFAIDASDLYWLAPRAQGLAGVEIRRTAK